MAKATMNTDTLSRQVISDVKCGIFKPVYLLMGDEPYYIDLVCDAILANCIEESDRDFNQVVCYGADVNADSVITAARRYPMFSLRQLVVVKEAQMMKDVEELSFYCENPLESTVLVICMKGAKADKRKALYKSVSKAGVVIESTALRDYEVPGWIGSFFASKGLNIAPDAATLFAEHTGVDLFKITVETEKMLKNLPEGTANVTIEDIEKNVGISRQYSVFELNKALSFHNAVQAMKIAENISQSPKFAIPMATSILFGHFYKILRYGAAVSANPSMTPGERASMLGINPYFLKEYDTAVRFYPVKKCMAIITYIKDADYRGKGGDGAEVSPSDLLCELVTRILS